MAARSALKQRDAEAAEATALVQQLRASLQTERAAVEATKAARAECAQKLSSCQMVEAGLRESAAQREAELKELQAKVGRLQTVVDSLL